MRAIVLAAGVGARLRPFTDRHPKCLLRFGNETLIERHLRQLGRAGVTDVAIVIGHHGDQVRQALEPRLVAGPIAISFVPNERFREGSALSLLKAANQFDGPGDALFMDADLLFGEGMLETIMAGPSRNALLVDERHHDSGEEVIAAGEHGRVLALGKRLSVRWSVLGESVGIFRVTAVTAAALVERLGAATREQPRIEYEPVVDSMLATHSFLYHGVGGLPWTEIDFPEDVDYARTHVFPRLSST